MKVKNTNKIIIVLGQTSTGKSDFAVEIAKHINGEIISADSRQVYKGMDLGTGKVPRDKNSSKSKHKKTNTYFYKNVPHHLLDVISPKKVFSVDDFSKQANKKIEEILKRPVGHHDSSGAGGKNVPIICGGTGFYIDTLINQTSLPKVPPNKKLRKKLYSKSAIALFEYLKKLDPERAKTIDKNNKVRLIRAIEIAKAIGKVPQIPIRQDLTGTKLDNSKSATNSAMAEFVASSNFEVLKIGLTISPEILKKKIYDRIIIRIKKGMLKEIKNLHDNGVSWKRMHELGLEYRYGALYWQKKLNKEEMIEKLNTETWHYAKRQKTWFKRDKDIIWINPLKKSEKLKVIKKVKNFLK